MPSPLGYRFHPGPKKLLACLHEFITGKYEGPIREHHLYGDDEPWKVYGNSTGTLHLFTPLKKISKGGSRFSRSLGKKGTWEGKNRGIPVQDNLGNVLGFKRKFTYKSSVDPSQNNLWLLEEYCLSQVPVSPPEFEYRKDFALCLLKKKKTVKNEEVAAAQLLATSEEIDSDLKLFLEEAQRAVSADANACLDSFFEGVLVEMADCGETALPNQDEFDAIFDELEMPNQDEFDAIFDELEMPNQDEFDAIFDELEMPDDQELACLTCLDSFFEGVLPEMAGCGDTALPNHDDRQMESIHTELASLISSDNISLPLDEIFRSFDSCTLRMKYFLHLNHHLCRE